MQRDDLEAREARLQRRKADIARYFESWAGEPANILLVETLSAGADSDKVRQLLSVAYRAGYGAGEAGMAAEMITSLFRGDRRQPR